MCSILALCILSPDISNQRRYGRRRDFQVPGVRDVLGLGFETRKLKFAAGRHGDVRLVLSDIQ